MNSISFKKGLIGLALGLMTVLVLGCSSTDSTNSRDLAQERKDVIQNENSQPYKYTRDHAGRRNDL